MKRIILIALALYLSTASLWAQVNSQVEVTKAYIPTVQASTKPLLKATIIDTAYLNPEVDYTITPLSISTPLQTSPINPATVTYWEYNKPHAAQLKLGAGYSLNSLLQANFATHNASVGYFAVGVDHQGNYSDIKSMEGVAVDATQVVNQVALGAGLYLNGRTLEGRASYSNDLYHRYAFEQQESSLVGYQTLETAVGYGDNFVDLSRFNFAIGAGYSYFVDRENVSSDRADFALDMAKSTGIGDISLEGAYQYVGQGDSYSSDLFSVGVGVASAGNSMWQLAYGARYYYHSDSLTDSPKNYILPQLQLQYSGVIAFTPFVVVDSQLTQNSFADLVAVNPYVGSGMALGSGANYNIKGGIMGQLLTSKVSYSLYAAYNIGVDSRYWCISVDDNLSGDIIYDNYFSLMLAGLNTTSFNVELEYKPLNNLLFSLDGHIYSYKSSDDAQYLHSQPNLEVALGCEYMVRDLRMGAKVAYIASRDASVSYTSQMGALSCVTLPDAVNVSLFADWRLRERLSIFVEGENLCGQNLYPWAMYRGYGVQVTAGIKLNFK